MRASRSCTLTCSGDIYTTVPGMAPGLVAGESSDTVSAEAAALPVSLANPKSRILVWPRVVMKMFAGFMSR